MILSDLHFIWESIAHKSKYTVRERVCLTEVQGIRRSDRFPSLSLTFENKFFRIFRTISMLNVQ